MSDALGTVLKNAGLTKIVMIRHANAKPRDLQAASREVAELDGLQSHRGVLKPGAPYANSWTVGDLTRELTPKGQEQATKAAEWLSEHQVRVVVSSEATRAWATKDIMAPAFPKGGPSAGPGCLTLPMLHPSRSGTPDCEKMFDSLGYGTLKRYFADTSVQGCEGRGEEVFRQYMAKVTAELAEVLTAGLPTVEMRSSSGNTVAIFGHAVFLNALAVAVGEAMGIGNAMELVGGMDLGETQGIMCDASAKTIQLCGVYDGGATTR
jgi:broad specificity phosphatase PhoE